MSRAPDSTHARPNETPPTEPYVMHFARHDFRDGKHTYCENLMPDDAQDVVARPNAVICQRCVEARLLARRARQETTRPSAAIRVALRE